MAKVPSYGNNLICPESKTTLFTSVDGEDNGGTQMYSLLSRRALGCSIATIVIDRVFAVPTGVGEMPAMRMLPGQDLPPPEGRLENALSSGIDSASAKELATAKLVLKKAPNAINPYQRAQNFD